MSLPETVTTSVCPKCGADVRAGSLFCYNCGGRVADETESVEPKPAADDGDPIAQYEKRTRPAPGLRPARDLGRRDRVFRREPKRVVWEPTTESADTLLIGVAAFLLVFTIVVIILVFSLR